MLRLANKSDIEAIYKIESMMFDESIYFKLSKKEIEKLLNKKSSYFYVYCDEKNIPIGYSLGIIINKKAIWFNSLAVLKEYQNSNVAKKLFDIIEVTSIDLKLDLIILEIRKDNKALFRRYKNMGYIIWKEIEHYYPDGCGAYRLIKCMK
ncbi:MAG: N-acetyltransferase [Sulfurimonas sp.]|uniref:GNAT family N-acetyltransferase n=1 Tax=Sulfurimonas sp. TaxID=2022749 RepID=UPI0026062CA5|nr:N-acetyltransferase [Sulfurimonas sp.]MDD2652246.1 N-acetyltransferase [Sulfurimonas sp.]MDD3451585.1 N-acetyltransferase [Sulfurimonas sp.]